MKVVRKSVSFFSLSSFLSLIFTTVFFVLPNSAYASYGWVMGSYKEIASAESMILQPGFSELSSVLVTTKAGNYKRRIIAGCFATQQEALKHRVEFYSVRKNNGIWLLKTNLGCQKVSNSNLSKPIVYLKNLSAIDISNVDISNNVVKQSVFTPKRWKFKDGNKIAYTDGTHPSLFFIQKDDSSEECYVIESVNVSDVQSIAPPQEESRYFSLSDDGSKKCKVAYIYKVLK